ncbi:MAG: FAD-binding oxidoreductase [Sandaracinaceae bacterium]|nr:FAD-binding oxidoreductase [Sandaracinaceae bacterium]
MHADVVVIGSGIAGLSAALGLARRGARALVLEQERLLASHSSARNASIWLPVDDDETTPELGGLSARLLDALIGREGWLPKRTGALLVARSSDELDESERGAKRNGLCCERVSDPAAVSAALEGGIGRAGLWVEGVGELDTGAMVEAIRRAAIDAGAHVRTQARVRAIVVEEGRVRGIVLEDGERIATASVVVAAGAWTASLVEACGAPSPIVPLRRHLAILEVDPRLARGPIVWSIDPQAYFRTEVGDLLASPCDEVPFEPCVPPVDARWLEELGDKLAAWAPALADARVRRAWACLRPYAPDREIVLGEDPRVEGLFVLGGLGGRGMTIGAGAGDLLARAIAGERVPARMSPARFAR